MSGKSINFDIKRSKKVTFIKTKNDIDFNKILVSKKESYGTKNSPKYFIGYNDDDWLCMKLPQMTGYVKHFDNNKTMTFKVDDNKLLKSITKYGKKLCI